MSAASTRPTIVFAGDSVTDCGRREDPRELGEGYVEQLAASRALRGFRVINRGVAGDRVRDLKARWEREVLAQEPSIVSILIGINDVWRRYDSDDPTPVGEFVADYRHLLGSLSEAGVSAVVCEPVLLPVNSDQEEWREDLEPKLVAVRGLAAEFGASLVPTQTLLTALRREGSTELAPDGVHPSPAGHLALAATWLAHAPITTPGSL